ncbi:hypothetical protein [Aminobacter aminovorans]|uniref:Uncharacterized protein n=1 Tax=Aminobacter aminovorans TaxID=83263 RepID=A0AAC8YMN0_AMIAI|nr:hypothetical protein [Aminobacter aminovorans]AMS41215.1 hypothetical protein AA2016_2287 [Aminobacter aminovorans]MBB3705802.1 hypothetical protein [Aminobacter aminovorans]
MAALIDSVVEAVRSDLLSRSQFGIEKYGVTLDRKDLKLRDWLQHAYEKTLDQANYLKRAIIEIERRADGGADIVMHHTAIASPAGERTRAARDEAMEATPATGQQTVGVVSPRLRGHHREFDAADFVVTTRGTVLKSKYDDVRIVVVDHLTGELAS